MDIKKNGLERIVEKELTKAVLSRMQTIDLELVTPPIMKQNKAVYDDVKEELNIPYINRGETPLAMDVFSKAGLEEKEVPVIVLIHGGGFCMGDRKISRPLGRWLAHKGYLVFSIEYRLMPKVDITEELDDVCAGLDLIGEKLVDHNVDFDRMYLIAESVGAYLATYVTAMHGSEKLQDAIGRKPSRFVFKALGLTSGVFYADAEDGSAIAEQMFGAKTRDKSFKRYMNPEDPEIISNLPPMYLLTSKGDFVNNQSFMMHKALKKAGKPCHLMYSKEAELVHAFSVLQIDNPKCRKLMDKMLGWFEEQTQIELKNKAEKEKENPKLAKLKERLADGSIAGQKMWQYIIERNSFDDEYLKRTAVIDGTREYTYRQMFREWERYARAFSGCGITEENRSRAAVAGAITAETLFCAFGLNMTGAEMSMFSYPDFLPSGNWKTMLQKEKITDLIIADIMVTPSLWEEIKKAKEELGLRNVILMHSKMGGPCVGPAELVYNEFNYHALKRREDTVFIDDLIAKNENTPVFYGKPGEDKIFVITHTSGTTKGTRKPIIHKERNLLNIAISEDEESIFYDIRLKTEKFIAQERIAPIFDFSSFHSFYSTVISRLMSGGTVIMTFFGFLHPKFIRAVDYYQLTSIVASGFLIDKWMEQKFIDDCDFSSANWIGLVGSYVSESSLKKYKEMLSSHGFRGWMERLYAMSEVFGNGIATFSDRDEMGQPGNEELIRIQDETDNKFYRLSDGPRTGILYMSGESVCCNELDGEKYFEYTVIDGRNYICTNDMLRILDDGKIVFVGRADKYFENNEGKRFDSGVVETQLSAHRNISQCAVAPVLEKRIHDTVPVLYVIPHSKGEKAAESIRKALTDVYVKEKKIDWDNMPVQLMIVDDIPVNQSGKIDIYKITRERLSGDAYDIVPVRKNGKPADIKLKHIDKLSSIVASVPEGMGGGSAFNIFDLFNDSSEDDDSLFPFMDFLPVCGMKKRRKELSLMDIVNAVRGNEEMSKIVGELGDKLLVKMMNMSGEKSGMKQFDYDIEE